MNIIAPVFDVQFIDNTDKQLVASLEEANYKVFPYPKSHDDKKNGIAIRKHQIKKITDLTMENILHLSAAEVLKDISVPTTRRTNASSSSLLVQSSIRSQEQPKAPSLLVQSGPATQA